MNYNTYVNILKETLTNKLELLELLISQTKLQEAYLDKDDLDKFEYVMQKKDIIIEKLNLIDEGFEQVYERIRPILMSDKELYQIVICELQELIRCISEKSIILLAIEKKNRDKFESYLMGKKREIKNYKINNQSVSNYYKNMIHAHQGESIFLDKKK